jgi:hypothetical protein
MNILTFMSWKIGLNEDSKLEKGILTRNMVLNVKAGSYMMHEAQDIKCQLGGFFPKSIFNLDQVVRFAEEINKGIWPSER